MAIAVRFHESSQPRYFVYVVAAGIESLRHNVVKGAVDGGVSDLRSARQTRDRTERRQPGLFHVRVKTLARASQWNLVRHRNKRQERILVILSPPPRVRVVDSSGHATNGCSAPLPTQRVFIGPGRIGAVDPGARATAVDLLPLVAGLEPLLLRDCVFRLRVRLVGHRAVGATLVTIRIASPRGRQSIKTVKGRSTALRLVRILEQISVSGGLIVTVKEFISCN